jgi:hypothetical protein
VRRAPHKEAYLRPFVGEKIISTKIVSPFVGADLDSKNPIHEEGGQIVLKRLCAESSICHDEEFYNQTQHDQNFCVVHKLKTLNKKDVRKPNEATSVL